jgi:hypothetical protein
MAAHSTDDSRLPASAAMAFLNSSTTATQQRERRVVKLKSLCTQVIIIKAVHAGMHAKQGPNTLNAQ